MVPLFNNMKIPHKLLFQIAYVVVSLFPVMREGLYNSFEQAILRWLEREKRKPLSKFDQGWHDLFSCNWDEIFQFANIEFRDYVAYDKAYPDRFRVKYDENGVKFKAELV